MTYRVNYKKIKELRQQADFTQEGFAAAIGVVLSTLRCIESGTKTPGISTLKKIAVNLKCNVDDLLYADSTA